MLLGDQQQAQLALLMGAVIPTSGEGMAAVTSPAWRSKAPEITAMDAPQRTGNEHNSPCLWVLSSLPVEKGWLQ